MFPRINLFQYIITIFTEIKFFQKILVNAQSMICFKMSLKYIQIQSIQMSHDPFHIPIRIPPHKKSCPEFSLHVTFLRFEIFHILLQFRKKLWRVGDNLTTVSWSGCKNTAEITCRMWITDNCFLWSGDI